MSIKIEISNQAVYLFIGMVVVLVLFSVVSAYQSGLGPSVMGHSADEIMVTVGGVEKSLQEALDENIDVRTNGDFNVRIITSGTGHDSETGTQACDSIGKKCVAVISNNFPTDVPYDVSASHYNHVCDAWYGGPSLYLEVPNGDLPGIQEGQDVSNIHSCDAIIGFYTTYLHAGVLRCGAHFSAICA